MTKDKRDSITKKAETVVGHQLANNKSGGVVSKAKANSLKKAEIATLIASINAIDLPPLPPHQPRFMNGTSLDLSSHDVYAEHAVCDSCADVRRKCKAFITSNGLSKAQFLSAIGNVQNNSWESFMKHTGAGAGVRMQPGAGNLSYHKAYIFLEKYRIMTGAAKSPSRIQFEAEHPRGYSLKHDDGKRWVFTG